MELTTSSHTLSPFSSAAEIAKAIAHRRVSSREMVDLYLRRIEQHNPALNAVITLDAGRAGAEADAADAAIARGEPIGPLHGVPVTIKDCFETAGMLTTAGSDMLADYVPSQDAVAVARLRAAGAVVLGKTNLPEWAGDAQTFNDLFGTTNNPWDLGRTPGGSSGGSAAAIASGLSGLELGSDLGGSLRIPAHFCGVYTLKPTWGIVPVQGHVPPPPGSFSEMDIAVVGPLARDARDLDLALSVMAGADAERGVGWRLHLPPARRESLAEYRIAAWLDDPYCSVDGEIGTIYARLVRALHEAGAHINETVRPVGLAEGYLVAQQLIQGSISQWLPEETFAELLERAATASDHDESPPVRWARNVTQRARAFQVSLAERLRLKAAWAAFFQDYDVLLCPVMPGVAFPHDHNPDVDARTVTVNGETRAYGDQWSWLQAIGVVHLPAVVAPVGLTASGLPVGIQIVAAQYEDRTAIDVATRIAEVIGGFVTPPDFA